MPSNKRLQSRNRSSMNQSDKFYCFQFVIEFHLFPQIYCKISIETDRRCKQKQSIERSSQFMSTEQFKPSGAKCTERSTIRR